MSKHCDRSLCFYSSSESSQNESKDGDHYCHVTCNNFVRIDTELHLSLIWVSGMAPRPTCQFILGRPQDIMITHSTYQYFWCFACKNIVRYDSFSKGAGSSWKESQDAWDEQKQLLACSSLRRSATPYWIKMQNWVQYLLLPHTWCIEQRAETYQVKVHLPQWYHQGLASTHTKEDTSQGPIVLPFCALSRSCKMKWPGCPT